jgi:lysophospholipase L1-like esterase
MSIQRFLLSALAAVWLMVAVPGYAADQLRWVTSWAASAHGPYPVGNATAMPDQSFAFPTPERGGNDQTFRMIVRPDIWGNQARIRLSNAFGTKAVTFDDIHVGLQTTGADILPGTNRPLSFAGKPAVTVAPGQFAWSDPVTLPFVKASNDRMLTGRKLVVSFHVVGETGPMTWHAKALTTSYLSVPGGGAHGKETTETNFPYSTTAWFFLDALDMTARPDTTSIVAFGDSITDGTASTLNGDDRWSDDFARRLHAAAGNRFAVVNEGIGGNQVIGPAQYTPAAPFSGGPSALSRLDRDVTSLSNVGAVIWLEGINDLGTAGASVDAIAEGYRQGVEHLRAKIPGVKIYVATLTSSLHSTNAAPGTPEVDQKRRALNQFFRTPDLFDGLFDFNAATLDPDTGELKAEYQPNSTTGGHGDKLHPNRAGYAAMARAINLKPFVGSE